MRSPKWFRCLVGKPLYSDYFNCCRWRKTSFSWTITGTISNCNMHILHAVTLVQPHVQLNLNTDSVMAKRELMFGVWPITKWSSDKHDWSSIRLHIWSHFSPRNMKHFKSEHSFCISFFALWRPPPPKHCFNDSKPCCFLWINYLSLYQWQRAAHWGQPCLKAQIYTENLL